MVSSPFENTLFYQCIIPQPALFFSPKTEEKRSASRCRFFEVADKTTQLLREIGISIQPVFFTF